MIQAFLKESIEQIKVEEWNTTLPTVLHLYHKLEYTSQVSWKESLPFHGPPKLSWRRLMKIASIMTSRIATVEIDDTLRVINNIFCQAKFHHCL